MNEDNRCFEWAVLSKLYPVGSKNHSYRTSKYEAHLGELNFDGITFPVKITDIAKFERQNPTLSIWVFGWNNGPYPIYEARNKAERNREVDLLLLTDPQNPEKTHYVWLKHLGKLLFKNSAHNSRVYPCRRCLHVHSREDLLESHIRDYMGIGKKAQRILMPEKGKDDILKFTSYHKQMRVPYVIYADFESLNIPVKGCANNPRKSSTRQTAKQTPCSYYYIIVRCDGHVKHGQLYRGENAVRHFLESLKKELYHINAVFQDSVKIEMTQADWEAHNTARECHICGEALQRRKGMDKVRDHCHMTGRYREAAHSECNLKLRISPHYTKVPVVIHNLRGYDGHLIMQGLGGMDWGTITLETKNGDLKEVEAGKISCIPTTWKSTCHSTLDSFGSSIPYSS
jgi:hypothetical protein